METDHWLVAIGIKGFWVHQKYEILLAFLIFHQIVNLNALANTRYNRSEWRHQLPVHIIIVHIQQSNSILCNLTTPSKHPNQQTFKMVVLYSINHLPLQIFEILLTSDDAADLLWGPLFHVVGFGVVGDYFYHFGAVAFGVEFGVFAVGE